VAEARHGHEESAPIGSLPEHVTTPLLALITARSLDEDYAHVAAHRHDLGDESQRGISSRRRLGTLVAVVAFGVLTTTAAMQTARDAEATELGRSALQQQIDSQSDRVQQLQADVRALEEANRDESRRNQTVGDQLADLRATVTRLELRTGFAPVHGPGLRITVADAADADPDNEIRDDDLAILVDGLWEAGAEAVAINDQRVNALGGIRNTNRAVHVNGVPILAPYVVTAIGDRGRLEADLLATSQGQEWFARVNTLGFQYQATSVADVRLPGAPTRPLRWAGETSEEPPGAGEGG
jgi:uncharacterized protein YlxW (UPF0749 family)